MLLIVVLMLLLLLVKMINSIDIITTLAGSSATSGGFSGDNGQATSALLNRPFGIALDTSGNVYIADSSNNRLRKITISSGIISTIAGSSSTVSYSGDNGQATSAGLSYPDGVALDSSGNIYIADRNNNFIRKVTISTGIITKFAGSSTSPSFSGDGGLATSANLNYPEAVALDSSGNVYIADRYNNRIRKVTISTGFISTIAGSSTSPSFSGDNGQATSATLYTPTGIALDTSGNVYIADQGNHRVRKVTISTGIITTIAGTGSSGYSGDDEQATAAIFNNPFGVALDSAGHIYIADELNCRIRKIAITTGIVTTIAGDGAQTYRGDNGAATSASIGYPFGVVVDSSGNVYISDYGTNHIRKVTVSPTNAPSVAPTAVPSKNPTLVPTTIPSLSPSTRGIITTVAGSSSTAGYSGDGGLATSAVLGYPWSIACDNSNNLYIADQNNHRIRLITAATGIITTIVGTGTSSYSGDGAAATSATMNTPLGVTYDSLNNLYITDAYNQRIRKVSGGIITTFAGSGATGSASGSFIGDNGQATAATLNVPTFVTTDSSNNLYITDNCNQRIRKITISTNIITTIAGSGATGSTSGSFTGDNGQATAATLNGPVGLAVDSSGNLYIGDTANHRIRKVTVSTGVITTIVGTGGVGYSGDNAVATSATIYYPQGVVVDTSGNIYIADQYNNRIRKVTISTGIISTIAGSSTTGSFSGDDGEATSARLYRPIGLAIDSSRNIYINDWFNNRIRKVTTPTLSPTTIPTTAPSTPSCAPSISPTTSLPSMVPSTASSPTSAPGDIITTLAGTGGSSFSGDGGVSTAAVLYQPTGIAIDASGNVYIADYGNQRIRKVTVSTGIITTIAGIGTSSYSGDNGPATSAEFYDLYGVAVDTAGNVYTADTRNHRIRKVTVSTGIITTIAGSSTGGGYSGDNGQATAATLNYPHGVAVDSSGNVYTADHNNNRIRKVTVSTGIITTIAGTGTSNFSGDNGPATSAELCYPYSVDVDSLGNVYIADESNHRIRKVTVSTGIITTIAGTGTSSFSGDNGPATAATLYSPSSVVVDLSGNVYIADCYNNRIRKVTVSTNVITTVAGSSTSTGYSGDGGAATSAELFYPIAVGLDTSGNIYIADCYNNRIRKVTVTTSSTSGNPSLAPSLSPSSIPTSFPSTSPTSVPSSYFPSLSPSTVFTISTIVGTGNASFNGDGGEATSADLFYPVGVAVDLIGNIYIADYNNNRVRKVTVSTGIISTIAGNGTAGYSGDNGQATAAKLYQPYGVDVDSSGNVYIADRSNNRVRKVTISTGIISNLAGSGAAGIGVGSYSGDNGQATAATLYYPVDIVLDSLGNVYISDYSNQRIRKVTVSTGIITTIAGTGNTGYSGDNGDATSALLNSPWAVAVDSSDNVYIADYFNNRVRKVTVSTGIITTVVGAGATGYGMGSYTGDGGIAIAATLNGPVGITIEKSGNIYISDRYNHRIRKVTISTNIITTVAGNGGTGSYSGDGGDATSAGLNQPLGIALDSSGNLYIVDYANSRIRKATIANSYSPSISPHPTIIPTIKPSSSIPTVIPSASPSTPISMNTITTIAGIGVANFTGDGNAATSASINEPHGIAVDAIGNIYFSDFYNHRIRKVKVSTGIITTYAGTGNTGYNGDNGSATSANLNYPSGLCADTVGNIYFTDDNRVRKILASNNLIITIAGTGTASYNGDNIPATSATLNFPTGVAVDTSGEVYIGDLYNHRIRKVTVSIGIMSTIAGIGTAGYSGDNGQATAAMISQPCGLNLDSLNNIYFGDDLGYNVIRKVTTITGIITTVAGIGIGGYNGDNIQATSAKLLNPTDIVLDRYDNLYICDRYNRRIRKVTAITGIITTIVGDGSSSSTGDGSLAVLATVNCPIFSRFDADGNYYISEYGGNRIRKVSNTTATINTAIPSVEPSALPTTVPSKSPTLMPSIEPNQIPSRIPSLPSMIPTSTPTSTPTITDNVAANLLAIPLDDKVAKAKIKYYLGAFMGYFLAIYICLYLYSFFRYGNEIVAKLYNTSYQSKVYIAVVNSDANTSNSIILSDFYRKNLLVQSNIKQEVELEKVKQAASNKGKMLGYEVTYSKGYREYVQQQRTLLGCAPFLYPYGYVVKIPCTKNKIALPPGRMEDLLLYICHNHPLFSCFYYMEGSKLGAHGTRVLYIGKDIVVFVLYQFANMLLQCFMLDGRGLGTFINLFIITPSAVSVGIVLRNLYTCPFTETVEFQRRYAKYQSTVLFIGRLAIVPIILIMFGSLVIACLFSSNRYVPMILVNYFIYVQFYGIILAIIKTMLLFKDNYYYQLSLFGVLDVLCIGRIYKERILAEQLVVDVDYAYRINTYIFGLFKVQKILNRDDAIKAKWITVVATGKGGGYDVEMKGNNDVIASNKEITHRNTASFGIDDIYSTNHDDEEAGNISSNDNSNDTNEDSIATENPIHSFASTGAIDFYQKNNQETFRLQQLAINNDSSTSTTIDNDAELYLEYQNLQSCHNDTVYDMNNTEAISFEEWKMRRKQFKQGTRGSFVKAFQVFEEREQVARDNLEQASMKNTMLLHSFKVKNVLASPTINRPK